ncbi:MAG TPA: hypothetical protein VJP81_08825 [Candidatus Dormibacteraeota bacterium]|nr:hypothetical protein [Candidatus Dormibacteraeota bacterium]
MELEAALFLAACVVAGFGITYLSGVALNLEERVVFGVVLGAMAVAGATFVPSLLARDVTVVTVLLGLALCLAVGATGVLTNRDRVATEWGEARRRWLAPLRSPGHPWPLLAIFVVCGAWSVHFLHQAFVYTPSGLYAGYVNIWGDWAAHLTYTGSFAYGHNFPPEYPVDPGHRFGYPFMIDFLAADLVPLGLSLTEAVTATSAILGLAFPAVFYLAALRFTAGRAASAIAVFAFLLSGGLGFVYFFRDVGRGGFAAIAHLPLPEYTLNRDVDLQWLNPVLAYLVPQRSVLIGFGSALIVLVLLWVAARGGLGWRPYVFAGLFAGALPIFHVHAWGTVVALALLWALFNLRGQWLGFFAPAVILGVPVIVWMWPPTNTSICGDWPSLYGYCIQPGWLAFDDWRHNGVWLFGLDFGGFWIWNTSLLLPLMIAGQVLRTWFVTGFTNWFIPVWLWFAVPNVVVLQPWPWDNTKFFVFWALLGSVLVGGVLAGMMRRGRVMVAAALVMLVLLGLAGTLDLARASDTSVSRVQFTDPGGLKVADWVRHNTTPSAIFAVADEHNSPIPTLAGRRVVIGYPGWLWTYGLPDYVQKSVDNKKILQGDASAMELVRKYRVDYVMIGPQEVPRGASRAYWDGHGTLVYDDGQYAVYRVGVG